jgi:hypothetical protein
LKAEISFCLRQSTIVEAQTPAGASVFKEEKMSATTKTVSITTTVVQGAASTSYAVDVLEGVPPEELGLILTGSPPTVSMLAPKSPLEGKIQSGDCIHSIRLHNLEIVYLVDCNHLMDVLRANANYPRQLVCSNHSVYFDPTVGTSAHRPLFKHQLPASPQLGFAMAGFPPVISSVDYSLQGRLFIGQTVEALWVPGRPLMNLQAGGFTSANVSAELAASSNVEGRQLTVRDGHKVQKEVGSSAGCDDCAIL